MELHEHELPPPRSATVRIWGAPPKERRRGRAIAGRAVLIAIAVMAVGQLAAAYLMLAHGVVAAWPAFVVVAVPVVAGLGYGVVLALAVPFEGELLEDDAVTWLRGAIERHQLQTLVNVAALDERRERGNFYHPASATIVLERKLAQAHTARAYAIAAHELGHARFHLAHPRVSRARLWCRGAAQASQGAAAGLLAGAAMVGGAWATTVAAALLAIAAVLMLPVLVDEGLASRGAMRELAMLPSGQRAAARRWLLLALGSYLVQAIAIAAPLVVWASLVGHLGARVTPPAPIHGAAHVVGLVAAGLVATGAVAALLRVLRRRENGGSSALALLGWLVAPLFLAIALRSPSAAAHGWTAVVAIAAVWPLLTLPLWLVVAVAARWLGRDLELLFAAPGVPATGALGRVTQRELADRAPADGVIAQLWTWRSPIAVVALVWAFLAG